MTVKQKSNASEDSSINRWSIKRSKSATNLIEINNQASNNDNSKTTNENESLSNKEETIEEIFKKWLLQFQSHSHKKLVEYKGNVLELNEENAKLKEDLIYKEVQLNNLKKSNKTLNIDFEETQKLNDELENKLLHYENIIEQFKLTSLVEHHEEHLKQQDLILNSIEIDTNNNTSASIRKSNSRNKISSLLSAAKLNDGMNIYGSFDRINLLNEFNLKSNKSLEKEFELLSIKKDAQTQYDESDSVVVAQKRTSDDNNAYSSYKDIFRKIYDTLNSSKTI